MIHMDILSYAMYFIEFYVVYVFFTMYFVRNNKINLWNHIAGFKMAAVMHQWYGEECYTDILYITQVFLYFLLTNYFILHLHYVLFIVICHRRCLYPLVFEMIGWAMNENNNNVINALLITRVPFRLLQWLSSRIKWVRGCTYFL